MGDCAGRFDAKPYAAREHEEPGHRDELAAEGEDGACLFRERGREQPCRGRSGRDERDTGDPVKGGCGGCSHGGVA